MLPSRGSGAEFLALAYRRRRRGHLTQREAGPFGVPPPSYPWRRGFEGATGPPAPLAGGCGPTARDISPRHASTHAHVNPMGGSPGPAGNRSGAMARQNSPNKNRAGPLRYKTHPAHPFSPHLRDKTRPARPKWPNLARFARAWRTFYRCRHQQAAHGELFRINTPPTLQIAG